MSSIIGFIGTPSTVTAEKIASVRGKYPYVYQKGFLTLLADSSLPTVLHHDPHSKRNWLVCGSGVKYSQNETRFMTVSDWEEIAAMDHPEPFLRNQDGHFLFLVWDESKLTVSTDSTGLKSLSYSTIPEGILFSDSHDFLARSLKPELHLHEFGSHWLLFNKLSDKSIFSTNKRVVGGNSITITIDHPPHVTESGYRWIPSMEKASWSDEGFRDSLRSFVAMNPADRELSLSLSGGMDSRVLLALMLQDRNREIHTHTFGRADTHDCVIAKQLSGAFGFQNEHYHCELKSADDALNRIRAYTNRTQVNNPASAFLQFQNYYALDRTRYSIIDGGFGEIWRREFFVKLFLKGEAAIRDRKLHAILPALRLHRADIFHPDAIKQMEKGIESELHDLFDSLPAVGEVSFENWLDIFAIKTRLLNYYANEQTVLDSVIRNVMPFASVGLLNSLCSTPVSERKNGKLFREIIRRSKPELARFRLAKNDITVSFSAGTIQLRILKKISRMVKKSEGVSDAKSLLLLLKPFVMDTLASGSFRDYPYYNAAVIKQKAERFYATGTDYADELDWWLAFEVLRQEYL